MVNVLAKSTAGSLQLSLVSIDKVITKKAARPFVKWVGGKWRLIPQLAPFLPKEFTTYYEPFLGGGALFFYLQPDKAVLNDINKTLIKAYEIIKNHEQKLLDDLLRLQQEYDALGHEERRTFYLERRSEYNHAGTESFRKVLLLIFLNKTCFNGMYRENSKGMFNVPFGDYKHPKIYDPDNINAVSQLLENVEVSSVSYAQAVKGAGQGDFVYLDPPYHPLNETSSFTSYSGDGFNKEDQKKLKAIVDDLTKRGVKVMLSNSASPFIIDLYKDYRQEFIMAGRAINSIGTKRGKIKELVILNY